MENLCTQDTAVAMLDTGINNIGKIVLCSIYWDGRIETFPEAARETIEQANDNGHTVLLGGDVNARSRVYSSNITDSRGRKLEELFLRNNLSFLNRGNIPTCSASIRGSVIDITGITNTMEDVVRDWKVSDKETHSDHNLIEFHLHAVEPEIKYKTTMSNSQKESFTKDLDHFFSDTLKNYQN